MNGRRRNRNSDCEVTERNGTERNDDVGMSEANKLIDLIDSNVTLRYVTLRYVALRCIRCVSQPLRNERISLEAVDHNTIREQPRPIRYHSVTASRTSAFPIQSTEQRHRRFSLRNIARLHYTAVHLTTLHYATYLRTHYHEPIPCSNDGTTAAAANRVAFRFRNDGHGLLLCVSSFVSNPRSTWTPFLFFCFCKKQHRRQQSKRSGIPTAAVADRSPPNAVVVVVVVV